MLLNFVPTGKLGKKLGDKVHVLLALCISPADPLWNNLFCFISWAKGNTCCLSHLRSDVKTLSAHYTCRSCTQEQVASGPRHLGWTERDRERALYSILGSIHRAGPVHWLSQPTVVMKTLVSEESPQLTVHVGSSSASLSCLRTVRDGITVQSL